MLKRFIAVLRGVKEPIQPIRQQDPAFFEIDEAELEPPQPIVLKQTKVADVVVVAEAAAGKQTDNLNVNVKSAIWGDFLGKEELDEKPIEYDFDEGLCFDIEYKDSKGKITQRSIECYGFKDNANSEVMNAHCYVRERMRTFRVDRIISANNSYTGEVYEDLAGWLDQLHVYFDGKGATKSRKLTKEQIGQQKLMNRCKDGLRVLFYFARCDGEYHAQEYFVIEEYVDDMSFLPTDKAPITFDTEQVVEWGEGLRVTYTDALRALNRLDERGELGDILKVVKKVIDADGVLHPDEHNAYIELLG